MTRPVETVAFVHGLRDVPAEAVSMQAKALNDSGVVDLIGFAHQLGNFIPDQLWTPQNSPLAAAISDPDSFNDAFLMAAYAAAGAPGVGLSVNTDSIRTGPAHAIQMMMTLAHITQGRALINLGAGELKSLKPYGWKRSQGLKRLEDLLNVFQRYWDSNHAISYEGHHWTLDKAFLGGAKPYKPRIHTMGGGPKISDFATTYCDGFSTAVPCVWPTPEHAAEGIAKLKQAVADKGRDPETFDIFLQTIVLMHEDEDVIAQAMENPVIRWIAAMWGRIQPGASWEEAGLAAPVPADWNYHMHFLPHDTDDSFLEEVLAKTTPEHVAASYLCGTPAQVADQLGGFIEAGATIVSPLDFLPFVLPPGEGEHALRRQIECLGHVKAHRAIA
jgi:phthiodiolone/phenolphthiodiolone dimycocerosates ketoreductase